MIRLYFFNTDISLDSVFVNSSDLNMVYLYLSIDIAVNFFSSRGFTL